MQTKQLTPEEIVTVFMTTQVNDERLADDPPMLKTEITSDALRQAVEGTMQISAKNWDMYRDIAQLSFLWHGRAYHFMYCGDGSRDQTQLEDTPQRRTRVYTDEEDLVKDAFALIRDIFGEINGAPMFNRMLVGWRMTGEIWPVLVNRAIKYRIPVYRDMLLMPNIKWAKGDYLGDLVNLYLQGGQGLRKLPGLADLLKFWGYWHDESRPMPEDIGAAVCDHPEATALAVESYLQDMYAVVTAYCCDTSTETKAARPLVGVPVP